MKKFWKRVLTCSFALICLLAWTVPAFAFPAEPGELLILAEPNTDYPEEIAFKLTFYNNCGDTIRFNFVGGEREAKFTLETSAGEKNVMTNDDVMGKFFQDPANWRELMEVFNSGIGDCAREDNYINLRFDKGIPGEPSRLTISKIEKGPWGMGNPCCKNIVVYDAAENRVGARVSFEKNTIVPVYTEEAPQEQEKPAPTETAAPEETELPAETSQAPETEPPAETSQPPETEPEKTEAPVREPEETEPPAETSQPPETEPEKTEAPVLEPKETEPPAETSQPPETKPKKTEAPVLEPEETEPPAETSQPAETKPEKSEAPASEPETKPMTSEPEKAHGEEKTEKPDMPEEREENHQIRETTARENDREEDSRNGLRTALILCIVLLGAVVLGGGVALTIHFIRKKKQKKIEEHDDSMPPPFI